MKILSKQTNYYVFYLIFSWLFYIALVSFSTFIHFIIGHKVNIIEDWMGEKNWDHLILSKTISFVLFVNLSSLYTQNQYPFRSFLKKYLKKFALKNMILTSAIFLFFYLTSVQKEFDIFSEKYQIFSIQNPLWGPSFYFFLDSFLISYLQKDREKDSFFNLLLHTIFFSTLSFTLFPITMTSLFFYALCFFILLQMKDEFLTSSFFIIFIPSFWGAYLNFAPLWQASQFYVKMAPRAFTFWDYLVLLVIVFIYKKYSRIYILKKIKRGV